MLHASSPQHQRPGTPDTADAIITGGEHLAVWSVAAFALALVLLLFFKTSASFEPPQFLLSLNFLCSTLVSVAIAAVAGRSFMGTGHPTLLLLGCGALMWGLSATVAPSVAIMVLAYNPLQSNTFATLQDTCGWLSAMLHLTATTVAFKPAPSLAAPRHWLAAAYLGSLVLVAIVALATLHGKTPPFFVADQEGTSIRQMVLGSTIAMLLLAAIMLQVISRHRAVPFARWYSLALFLFAIGVVGLLAQQRQGSPVGWVGRSAIYLGGLYVLRAVLQLSHERSPRLMAWEQMVDGPARQWAMATAIAVVSAATAMVVRMYFLQEVGATLPSMTFVPAVMLASFFGGYRAGLVTTIFSVLLILFLKEPAGQTVFLKASSLLDDLFFLVSGLMIALAARGTQRAESRALLAEVRAAEATEKDRLIDLLKVNEERFANVIEGTGAGIWDWHVQTGEVVINERWAEIVGYTLADLAPLSIETWTALAHPDDLRRSHEQLVEVFAQLRPQYDLECRMKHRNGHWIWVHDRGKVIEWFDQDTPRRMIGSHTDITARKIAEEQLKRSTREQQAILETVPVGIIKVTNLHVVWSNRAFEGLLGYSKEELFSQSTRKIYPSPEEFESVATVSTPLFAQGATYESYQRLLRKDGSQVLVHYKGRAIDPDNPTMGSIWIAADVTALKRAEEADQDRAALFQAMFSLSLIAQLLVDPDNGAMIDANEAAASYYGYPLEDLRRMNLADINILSLMELKGEITQGLQREKSLFAFQHRLATGEIREVETYFSPIVIGGQMLLHILIHDMTERTLLEMRAQEQKRNFHNLVETTSDLIVVANFAGDILFSNTPFKKRLEYSQEELETIHLLDLHPPEMRQEAEASVKAMLCGEQVVCPLPVLTKNGQLVPVETRAWIGKWNDQDCLVGFIKDLSAELEAQQRFERLFHNNPVPMALLTWPDRRLVDVNEALLTIAEFPKQDVIGKQPSELGIFREQPEDAEMLIEAIVRQGRFSNIEMRVIGKHGKGIVGLFSGELINNHGKDYLLAIMIDITKRKWMEETLRIRDATLTAIIENQPGLIWLKDPESRFLAVNSQFARTCGLQRPEDVVGKTDLDVWPLELADKYRTDDQMIMQAHQPLVVEELVSDQGEPKWFETFKTPIFDDRGTVIGTAGFARDITARKQTEAALQRANDAAFAAVVAQNKLLSTVAHEFRTPLMLLQSSLDILDRYSDRLSEAKRSMQQQRIRSAARQLIGLANTVLTYTRMEKDAVKGLPVACGIDIGRLCRVIAEETQAAWAEEHRFEITIGFEEASLVLDPVLFRRILENLLTNAFRYTPPSRAVFFKVNRDCDWLCLTIADEGIGIEEEDQPHVFELLFRGRNVGQSRGMGMGLSIVSESVQQMEGTITLHSAIGLGTVFVVHLPWREASERSSKAHDDAIRPR